MIVLDASAMVELLCQTSRGVAIAGRLAGGGPRHAPHLIDVEVASALRRQVSLGAMTVARAAEALEDLGDFPVTRHAHTLLLPRIWQLRVNYSAYDAAYLALTEALDATLFTCDGPLGRGRLQSGSVEVF